MSWFGKVVGGSLGFAFGGPLGVVLGAALGHVVDKAVGAQVPAFGHGTAQEQHQAAFFVTTFALLGKMAKADGQVSPDEIRSVENYMHRLGFDARRRKLAIGVFQEAKNAPVSHLDYAEQFARIFGAAGELKVELIRILHEVALADGQLHPNEATLLREVAEVLGLSAASINGLLGGATASGPDPYGVLGVDRDADWDTIKGQYRDLVRKFHPDSVVSKGLPDEFTEFAKERLQEINNAYEVVKRERGR